MGQQRAAAAMAVTAAVLWGSAAFAPTSAAAADVLILAPTVSGMGAVSLESQIITSTGPVPSFPTLTGLGMTVDIVLATGPNSWATPPQPYSAYKAIVLGDPGCALGTGAGGLPVPLPVAAAEANAATWAAAVTGNVIIIGTDPSRHAGHGGAQLWQSAIRFAAAGPGTGAAISLSCYYDYPGPSVPTLVNVLSGFGVFKVTHAGYPETVAIVATSPALVGLTAATLSNWSYPAHEGFTEWPTSFIPLAMVTDANLPNPFPFTSADGRRGFPYILARGVTLSPLGSWLKVCKVAGPGVVVGTLSTFHAGAAPPFTVRAGAGPGGTCTVGLVFDLGSTVTVTETLASDSSVTGITVAPSSRGVGTPNLAGGSATVTIGTGVTEVTFTNKRPTGFLEICKQHVATQVLGGSESSSFTVTPGNLGPFVVQAGSCSAAIEVGAGTLTIRELPTPGTQLVSCSTIPATKQGACTPAMGISQVSVIAGDVSTQTIAIFTNGSVPLTPGNK